MQQSSRYDSIGLTTRREFLSGLQIANRSWRNELFEARYLSAFVPFTRFLLFVTGRYLRRLERLMRTVVPE